MARSFLRRLDAEVLQELLLPLLYFGVVERLHDPAAGDQVVPIGEGGGEVQVLLDQQHRHAVLAHAAEDVADLLDQQRGEALGGLVGQQHLGAGAQHACQREHLLLPAGQVGAALLAPVGQHRERLVDTLQRPAVAADHGREREVLLDVQAGVDAAVVGDVAQARPGTLVRRLAGDVGAVQGDDTVLLAVDAHQGAQQRRLPGAVATHQGRDLSALHLEADVLEDPGLAVPGGQPLDAKQRTCPGRR
jgi:hypothetical protein